MFIKTAVTSPQSAMADLRVLYDRKTAVEELIRSLERYSQVVENPAKSKETRH